jgi:PE family
MAGGHVSVDPGALLTGAAEFQHLADLLSASALAVSGALQTMAGAAGDGNLTGSLSSAGQDARNKIEEGSQQLTAVAQGLTAIVQNYVQADRNTARGMGAR